jgi:hypothetical protein
MHHLGCTLTWLRSPPVPHQPHALQRATRVRRCRLELGRTGALRLQGRLAFSPLLDKPLEGPVYLRSSSHNLPDLVADLNDQVHFVLAGRVDSVRGGIRNTFECEKELQGALEFLQIGGGGGARGLPSAQRWGRFSRSIWSCVRLSASFISRRRASEHTRTGTPSRSLSTASWASTE